MEKGITGPGWTGADLAFTLEELVPSQSESFAAKMQVAMRQDFGGHAGKAAE